ncbi:MAG: hypothetical protein ABI432_10610 [Flavobacteriales bacterium]
MNSSAILRKQLASLAAEFPSVRLRYQFDELAQTHMVEVSPEYLYEVDDNFKSAQAKVIEDFTQQFPMEGLCFIGPNDIIGIEGELEVFHGFWSDVEIVRPMTFTWPTGFVPSLPQTRGASWLAGFHGFGLSSFAVESSSPFTQGSFATSFVLESGACSTDYFDFILKEEEHGEGDLPEALDYALAA